VTRIGVLIVDDSAVIRRLLTSILESEPDIDVVAAAANGRMALEKLTECRPDIVILDVEMPVMDGLATLRALRIDYPKLPVVMFSSLTERGAAATLDALAAGASDYVTKPAGAGSVAVSLDQARGELVPKVRALVGAVRDRAAGVTAPLPAAASSAAPSVPFTPSPRRAGLPERVEVIAVGCSTGGPDALAAIVAQLPKDFPVPILVVQHMPPLFTRMFAERLGRNCELPVQEAAEDQLIEPGTILVAPGDSHLTVRRQGLGVRVRLSDAPPEHYCRPAVDVLFRSVAEVYGNATLACVLTGMGRDGALGAERVRAAGGRIVVQDQATSVVWGMPGAVVKAGLADDVVPLAGVADTLIAAARLRRQSAAARTGT
jgi:two-component system chemotaxis response regulator CheB